MVLVSGCQTIAPEQAPPPQQSPLTVQLKRAPEPCLKHVYVHCSREASRRVLGLDEATLCSMVYETLLRDGFGGDFHAFLAWSREHPDDAPIEPALANACAAARAENRALSGRRR